MEEDITRTSAPIDARMLTDGLTDSPSTLAARLRYRNPPPRGSPPYRVLGTNSPPGSPLPACGSFLPGA